MNSDANSNLIILATIKTLKYNSNGIYNYNEDTSNIQIEIDKINKSKYLIRKKNNIIINKEQQSEFESGKEEEILFYIRKSFKTGLYELINPVRKKMIKNISNIDSLNLRPWLILNSKQESNEIYNEDYNLNENDIIKLGRRKYEVIKINISSFNNNNKLFLQNSYNYNISEMNKRIGSIFDINLNPNQYIVTEEEKIEIIRSNEKEHKIGKNNNKEVFQQSDNLIFKHNFNNYSLNNTINNETKEINGELCLICFEVESTKDNPKICLCSCKNYIHYKCLKEYNYYFFFMKEMIPS